MRILVVEDEEKVASFLKKGLEQSGYLADIAATGEEALEWCDKNIYDGILLDIMLPGMDGRAVVRQLRSQGYSTPVLALTARGSLEDRVAGLDSGCDDYLAKPFAFDELLARLRALHRRGATATRLPTLEYRGLTLDPVTRAVKRGSRKIELTNKEYALLEMLLRHPEHVYTRTSLLESIWGYDYDGGGNVLEVYINFVRKKVDAAGERKLLHTVRGVGYVLREEPE